MDKILGVCNLALYFCLLSDNAFCFGRRSTVIYGYLDIVHDTLKNFVHLCMYIFMFKNVTFVKL